MIGRTLQNLRIQKGFSLRELSEGILSYSQLSKIENNSQIPSVDKFIRILYRMNIEVDEFCMFLNNDYINSRTKLKYEIGETLRKRDIQNIKSLIDEMHLCYEKYDDMYFYHMGCILKAHKKIIINNDYNQAGLEVAEIAEYLFSTENWLFYELSLLNNVLFFFEIDAAIQFGNQALKTIKKSYTQFKNDEITRRLLNNLAIYTLKDKSYYMDSYSYSSTAIGLPQSTQHIYSTVFAKIINQIACYKLQNGEYCYKYLSDLINYFSLIQMGSVHKELLDFVKGHGIDVK